MELRPPIGPLLGRCQPVWTGSCPLSAVSSAGAQATGTIPAILAAWYQLVKEVRPSVVFGEQVESAIGHGWLGRLAMT